MPCRWLLWCLMVLLQQVLVLAAGMTRPSRHMLRPRRLRRLRTRCWVRRCRPLRRLRRCVLHMCAGRRALRRVHLLGWAHARVVLLQHMVRVLAWRARHARHWPSRRPAMLHMLRPHHVARHRLHVRRWGYHGGQHRLAGLRRPHMRPRRHVGLGWTRLRRVTRMLHVPWMLWLLRMLRRPEMILHVRVRMPMLLCVLRRRWRRVCRMRSSFLRGCWRVLGRLTPRCCCRRMRLWGRRGRCSRRCCLLPLLQQVLFLLPL